MNKDEQRLIEYLQHIVKAIVKIDSYVEDIDEVAFLNNELIQDAVIRNIEVIGEASRNIGKHYPEYLKKHEEVPFLFAYEMRNALAHGYFKVDLEIVWVTVERDLPEFMSTIETLLSDFK